MTAATIRHPKARRAGMHAFGLAAMFALGGCVSPDGTTARLDPAALPPIDKETGRKLAQIDPNGALPGVPVAATPSRERYADPHVAALNSGTPVNAETTAPPPGATDPTFQGAQQASAANLGELITQPTTVAANRNSLFANQQMAYVAESAGPASPSSGSIVPQDMPMRRGINPSLSSVYSAPRPSPSATYGVPEPAEPTAALDSPTADAATGYDPAEPLPQSEQPKSAAGKRFTLMRLLGKSGG